MACDDQDSLAYTPRKKELASCGNIRGEEKTLEGEINIVLLWILSFRRADDVVTVCPAASCAPIVSLRYVNLNVLRGMPLTMPRNTQHSQEEIQVSPNSGDINHYLNSNSHLNESETVFKARTFSRISPISLTRSCLPEESGILLTPTRGSYFR